MNYHREQFLNPLFDPHIGTVLPDMSRPINFRLWNSYYLRYTTSYKITEYSKKIHTAKVSGIRIFFTPPLVLDLERKELNSRREKIFRIY